MYNLMVLDDENIIRRGIRILIDFEALDIGEHFEAQTGEEALEIMKSSKIDIVLADINMPIMDGLEFARRAKEMDPSVRIALMTGYDYLDYAISAIKIGVDDYVLKPVSKEDVRKLLIRLIERIKADQHNLMVRAVVERITFDAGSRSENGTRARIDEILREHIGDSDFSLHKLGELMGYSISYLSTQFKQLFGENFRDYFLNLRMDRAKILLLSTDMKNYEIAAAVGIEDSNYFSVCFRRRYQMTTKEYRMGERNGEKV